MLETHTTNKKVFHFIDSDKVDRESNIFTIIVGKNGTGKSRLLSSIASEFISNPTKKLLYSEYMSKRGNTDYSTRPSKVIAASTSPFDRFPIGRRTEKLPGYSYLGLRDLPSYNFGLAYMSKIISSLIEAFIENPKQIYDITNVLNYLGYKDIIRIKLEPRLTSRLASELLGATDAKHDFDTIMSRTNFGLVPPINKKYFYTAEGDVDSLKLDKLISILKDTNLPKNRKHIQFEINRNGIISHELFDIPPSDLVFLIHSGVVRLREAFLEKLESEDAYSISDASSGEQSVVLGFLGIASQIKDYALICIDEPEICLHPEWQEKYITMLLNTFRRYKGCHFLIATHSPQIVSNLESRNCFILSMDSGLIIDASELINRSADFQLANVFKSPGFRNEYLSRIALNIFTKVSARKYFDDKDYENYNVLISQESFLEKSDPVYTLISAIKEIYKDYAGNK